MGGAGPSAVQAEGADGVGGLFLAPARVLALRPGGTLSVLTATFDGL